MEKLAEGGGPRANAVTAAGPLPNISVQGGKAEAEVSVTKEKKSSAGGKPKRARKVLSLTPTKKRILEQATEISMEEPDDFVFQHSALCQTYLPYREPKGATTWQRKNGNVSLLVVSGHIIDPRTGDYVSAGLPFGPKARLIFAHLNSRALKAGSRVIELEEETFTSFVRAMQSPTRSKASGPNGRELRAYKEQLKRFSVAQFTIAMTDGVRARQRSPQIITELDIEWTRKEHERLLWPERIVLSAEYWESLQRHAVPLDTRALAALSHNALSLDLYHWLAQRLHRIPTQEELLLSRQMLFQQFGEGYKRERDFWNRGFLPAFSQVHVVYPHAKVEVVPEGLRLRHSEPPVRRRQFVVPGSLEKLELPAGG